MWYLGIFIATMFVTNVWQSRSIVRVDRELLTFNKSQAEKTNMALAEIHTLVNSNLTRAQQSEYDATARDLASLEELVDLKTNQGIAVSVESLSTIELVKIRIKELQRELNHKEAQAMRDDQGEMIKDKR